MRIPFFENAIVPEGKIAEYLLNPDHADGASKARFFMRIGFDAGTLSAALLKHIRENDFTEVETTLYGTKYGVEGLVDSPFGFRFYLRSIWIIPNGEPFPKLITAYPSKK